jgi:tetratricopeptide (TPR) repeat protein
LGSVGAEAIPNKPPQHLRPNPDRSKTAFGLLLLLSVLGAIAYPFAIAPIGIQLNRLGVENITTKRYNWARFYLELTLRLGTNKPRVYNNLGYLYERMGEIDLARENFRQAKLLGDPFGCNNEAFIYLIQNKYQQAEQLLRTCLPQMQSEKIELGEYLVRKNLGWALLMKPSDWEQGDYSEAEQYLKEAIALRYDGGSANCLLAQVFEKQNRTSEALMEWQFCQRYVSTDRLPESDWKKQAEQRLVKARISLNTSKE